MRQATSNVIAVVTALLAVGCAGQTANTSASPLTGQICGIDRVPEQDTTWNEVAGDGFTYCVPATWRAAGKDARRWRAADVDLSWSDSPAGATRRVPFAVRRMDGRGSMQSASIEAVPPADVLILSDRLEGRTVRLMLRGSVPDDVYPSTDERAPELTFSGQARTKQAARAIVAAYRSIRFAVKP